MKPSTARSQTKRETVAPPAPNCTITFGHNTPDRLVCMLFSVPATQLVFSPEDAEDVARKLLHYAKAARGEVVT
jgi:hypothetical protein